MTEPGGEPLVPELTQAIEASRLTIDRGERASAIGDISAAVLEAGTTAVPICVPEVVLASTKDVSGLEVPILGNYDFRDMSFNEYRLLRGVQQVGSERSRAADLSSLLPQRGGVRGAKPCNES